MWIFGLNVVLVLEDSEEKLLIKLLMTPVNKDKVFTYREKTCSKNFNDRSNRNRHEKRFNHKVGKRRCHNGMKIKEMLLCNTWMLYELQIQR